jgi:hypothetical protein
MKFITFNMFDAAKGAEIAQASDKVAETPGQKLLAQYVCEGLAFPGQLPNTLVAISIAEVESNEAMAATQYPLSLAGGTIWSVPVLEMPVGGGAAEEKKYRK